MTYLYGTTHNVARRIGIINPLAANALRRLDADAALVKPDGTFVATGTEDFVLERANELKDKGHDVKFVADNGELVD